MSDDFTNAGAAGSAVMIPFPDSFCGGAVMDFLVQHLEEAGVPKDGTGGIERFVAFFAKRLISDQDGVDSPAFKRIRNEATATVDFLIQQRSFRGSSQVNPPSALPFDSAVDPRVITTAAPEKRVSKLMYGGAESNSLSAVIKSSKLGEATSTKPSGVRTVTAVSHRI